MTNEELKDTIVYIATTRTFTDSFGEEMGIDEEVAKGLADTLIEEGLCDKNTLDEKYQTLMAAGFVQLASLRLDLEKVLHRAEVAERALKNLCEHYTGFTCAFCYKRNDDWNNCKHTKDDQNKCVNEFLQKYINEAEKELSEEEKNE